MFSGPISDSIDGWLEEKERSFQEPFINRIRAIDERINELEVERISANLAVRWAKIWSIVLVVLAVLAAISGCFALYSIIFPASSTIFPTYAGALGAWGVSPQPVNRSDCSNLIFFEFQVH
jgi:hypothetical protein